MKLRLLIFFLAIVSLSSCNYNSSVMLRTKDDYPYSTFSDTLKKEYRIAPNDVLNFRIYSNEGFKLIDLTTLNAESRQPQLQTQMNYLVEHDGFCKLPILGRIKLSGMTLREAEMILEQKYAEFYNRPFVLLDIANQRIVVFPGGEAGAKVIPLANNNTTMIEGLALAGGISMNGKANRIKLIRKNTEKQKTEVYLFDLSTMEGLQFTDVVLQANDVVYVEPKTNIGREVIRDVLTGFGLISSTFAIIQITLFLRRNF